MSDTIRVLRLIEYEGKRSIVERQIERSIQGTKMISAFTGGADNGPLRITAVTLGIYPEVIEEARKVNDPRAVLDIHQENERLKDTLAEYKERIKEIYENENTRYEVVDSTIEPDGKICLTVKIKGNGDGGTDK